jgi:hypothetical protein
VDDQRDPDARDAPAGPAVPAWAALGASLALHAVLGLALYVAARPGGGGGGAAPMSVDVDIEVAPVAPVAELLPPEQRRAAAAAAHEVVVPEPAPAPPPPEEPAGEAVALPDAGVPPPDAGAPTQVADAGIADDAAARAAADEDHRDAGARGPEAEDGEGLPSERLAADEAGADEPGGAAAPGSTTRVSAGTAANLLAFFPADHIVTVLIRFDRLRGTEWARIAQDILAVMPDYTTLVADPGASLADILDLIAVSTPRPRDVPSTLVAVKSKIPQAELRDFLDEPGAPVRWSRVRGGVLGSRGKGKRVFPKDPRVFLAPHGAWMVLARPADLPNLLDPAAGDLDGAAADPAALPAWLARLPDLEAESGIPDGPALMMTLAPRGTRWQVPDVGLHVRELPSPERMTLSLELDRQGFKVRGNLRFRSDADAVSFVERVETARATALGSAVHRLALGRVKALNAVSGLTLARTGKRVSYATSISIADARILMTAGTTMIGGYFESAGSE